ncbi:hypothetical protein Snoj_29230 [Streptomyces nojiriensis]|uniref:Uncharacterized protein n=1 Tax=Streptomyces nojiriensis TaxID=66374 RepID=A0ABQ3SLI7_9ACTN|nr:hypothetical protein GCM10010205_77350 [Streptomyces nojiriensis]GHI69005.1 hypothetical protein Snoj_29230 [Streptomyces nojiriensis]
MTGPSTLGGVLRSASGGAQVRPAPLLAPFFQVPRRDQDLTPTGLRGKPGRRPTAAPDSLMPPSPAPAGQAATYSISCWIDPSQARGIASLPPRNAGHLTARSHIGQPAPGVRIDQAVVAGKGVRQIRGKSLQTADELEL